VTSRDAAANPAGDQQMSALEDLQKVRQGPKAEGGFQAETGGVTTQANQKGSGRRNRVPVIGEASMTPGLLCHDESFLLSQPGVRIIPWQRLLSGNVPRDRPANGCDAPKEVLPVGWRKTSTVIANYGYVYFITPQRRPLQLLFLPIHPGKKGTC